MIPEENPAEVEATIRRVITDAVAGSPGRQRGHQAHPAGPRAEAAARQQAAGRRAVPRMPATVFGEPIPASGTPLYTDARLYCEQRHPGGAVRLRAAHGAGKQCQARRRAHPARRPAARHEGGGAHLVRPAAAEARTTWVLDPIPMVRMPRTEFAVQDAPGTARTTTQPTWSHDAISVLHPPPRPGRPGRRPDRRRAAGGARAGNHHQVPARLALRRARRRCSWCRWPRATSRPRG